MSYSRASDVREERFKMMEMMDAFLYVLAAALLLTCLRRKLAEEEEVKQGLP